MRSVAFLAHTLYKQVLNLKVINLFLHSHIKSVFAGIELSLLSGMEGTEIKFNMDHRHFHTLTQLPFNTEFFGLHFSHLNTIKNGGSNGLREIWHVEM